MKVSIIIPVLNEVSTVGPLLDSLQPLRQAGHEILVVDGGSTDGTVERVRDRVDRVLQTTPGRAMQMNLGAENATGEIFWFLHADSHLLQPAQVYAEQITRNGDDAWGWFPVSLSSPRGIFRLIGFMMNLRARISSIATGDQGIYVSRKRYVQTGGFQPVPIMEDIRLSSALKKVCKPSRAKPALQTSSRRWERNGVFRTIFLMWYLRLAHFLGVRPDVLARKYHS